MAEEIDAKGKVLIGKKEDQDSEDDDEATGSSSDEDDDDDRDVDSNDNKDDSNSGSEDADNNDDDDDDDDEEGDDDENDDDDDDDIDSTVTVDEKKKLRGKHGPGTSGMDTAGSHSKLIDVSIHGATLEMLCPLNERLKEYGQIDDHQWKGKKKMAIFKLSGVKDSGNLLNEKEIIINGTTLKMSSVIVSESDDNEESSESKAGASHSNKTSVNSGSQSSPQFNTNPIERDSDDNHNSFIIVDPETSDLNETEKNDLAAVRPRANKSVNVDKNLKKNKNTSDCRNAQKSRTPDSVTRDRKLKTSKSTGDVENFSTSSSANKLSKAERASKERSYEGNSSNLQRRSARGPGDHNARSKRDSNLSSEQCDVHENTGEESEDSSEQRDRRAKNKRQSAASSRSDDRMEYDRKRRTHEKRRQKKELAAETVKRSDVLHWTSSTILVQDAPDNIDSDMLKMIVESKKYTGCAIQINPQRVVPVKRHIPDSFLVFLSTEQEAKALLKQRQITYGQNSFRTSTPPVDILQIILCSIMVTDIPETMDEEKLTLFFGNEKRGGGEIKSSRLNKVKSTAVITFQEESVARSLIKTGTIKFNSCIMKMKEIDGDDSLMDDATDSGYSNSVVVRGIPTHYSDDKLKLLLENKTRYDYIDICRKEGSALVTYNNRQEAESVQNLRKIEYGDAVLHIDKPDQETFLSFKNKNETNGFTNTVKVINVPQGITSEILKLYFTNAKKSDGGEIENMQFSEEKRNAVIVFKDSKVAERVCGKEHQLASERLTVLAAESNPNVLPLAVEVTGFSQPPTENELRGYFGNNRQSGGGSVEDVFTNRSKLSAVITFHEESAVLGVLNHGSHMLKGRRLLVERLIPAPPPIIHNSVEENLLLVKNIALSAPNVETSVKSFLKKEANSPILSVKRCSKEAQLLITFQHPPDYKSLRLLVCKKPFLGSMISVHRVSKPRELIVTGSAVRSISQELLYYFENRSTQDVKDVDIRNDNCAIVIFEESIADCDSLVGTHTIGTINFKAEAYYAFRHYPALGLPESDAAGVARQIHGANSAIPDNLEVEVEPKLWEVAQNSKEIKDFFEECIEKEGYKMTWGSADNKKVQLKSTSQPCASDWEKTAEEKLKSLLSETAIDIKIDHSLEKVQHELQNLKKKHLALRFEINVEKKLISVYGFKSNVDRLIEDVRKIEQHLTNEYNESEQLIVYKPDMPVAKYDLLESSGFFEEMKAKSKHFTISLVSGSNVVEITTKKSDMDMVKQKVLKQCCAVECEKPKFDKDTLKCLHLPEIKTIIERDVRERYPKKHVKIQATEEACEVYGFDRDSVSYAVSLSEQIVSSEFSMENSSGDGAALEELKKITETIRSEFSTHLAIFQNNSTVQIVGNRDQVKLASNKIECYLTENRTIIHKAEMMPAYCRIIRLHLMEELSKITKYLEDYSLPKDGKCFFELKGKPRYVNTAILDLNNLASRIFPVDHNVAKGEFFLTKAGSDRLHGICRNRKVEIEVITNEVNEAAGGQDDTRQTVIGKHGQKVTLLDGDITKYCNRRDCAVIVWEPVRCDDKITVKATLNVVTAGGNDVKFDLKNSKADKKLPTPGDTLELNPGDLVCRKIIVGFAPLYKIARHGVIQSLELAVEKCLEHASRLKITSILMAYAEEDVFKFPVNIGCEVFSQALVGFFKNHPATSVRDIFIVDPNTDVLDGIQTGLEKLSSEENMDHSEEHTDLRILKYFTATPPISAAAFKQVSQGVVETAEGVRISLSFGSLINEKVDALVNTCNISMDLSHGAVSQNILKTAGNEIQVECSKNKPPKLSPGDIVKTAGYKLQCRSVYHGSIVAYGSSDCEKSMRALLHNVLTDAHKCGLSSLAIPAIGTGNLKVPHEIAAKVMFDEVEKFSKAASTTHLKNIRFVVYDQDKVGVKTFNKILTEVVSGSGGPSGARGPRVLDYRQQGGAAVGSGITLLYDASSKIATIGSLKLVVKTGDITKEVTDAIVNSTNPSIDLRRGQVSMAIAKAAGEKFISDCKAGQLNDRQIFVSSGGKLPARHVIHVVAGHTEDGWVKQIGNCLLEADFRGFDNVTFPLLGTGNMTGSAADMADIMTKAVVQFLDKRKPSNLRKIVVCVYESDKTQQFTSALQTTCNKPRNIAAAADPRSARMKIKPEAVDLQIYGFDQESILAAIRDIDALVTEEMSVHTFDTQDDIDIIKQLTTEQIVMLKNVKTEGDLDVEIEVIKTPRVNMIEVKGKKDDVTAAVNIVAKTLEQFKNQLHQRDQAAVLKNTIQWRYNNAGTWEAYAEKLNANIEKAHASKKTAYEWDEKGQMFRIVFNKLREECVTTGDSTDVKRVVANENEFPAFWDKMDESQHLKVVPLNPSTEEYKKVEQEAKQTAAQCLTQVVGIQRIQNKKLHKQYMAIKEHMETQKRNNTIERLQLWHGTKVETIPHINAEGFDRSFTGANATAFGLGSYFAVDFAYSARPTYSPPDPTTGVKHIYQCKVLCGDFVLGDSNMRNLPAGTPAQPYCDSAVDKLVNPNMFVIFRDAQAYPAYLIYFK